MKRDLREVIVVVITHIYPPFTGERQTLNIGRSAHFSLQLILRGWRNLQSTCIGFSNDLMFL